MSRPLPTNQEAEVSTLGSVLLSETALRNVPAALAPDDFYRLRHGLVFGAMLRLRDRQRPIDVLTVCEELSRAGQLEEAGGKEYVHSLPNLVPAAANVRVYGTLVLEHAQFRRVIDYSREAAQAAFALDWSGVALALEKLAGVRRLDAPKTPETVPEALREIRDELRLLRSQGDRSRP